MITLRRVVHYHNNVYLAPVAINLPNFLFNVLRQWMYSSKYLFSIEYDIWPLVTGGEERGAGLTGGGSALASRLFAKIHLTPIPKTGWCQDMEKNSGRESKGEKRRWTRNERTPHGLIGAWVQAEGGKGGSVPAQEMTSDTDTRCEAQGWSA